jgi:hypothetical protein
MECPRCRQSLQEASFHLDVCEDAPELNLVQVVISHSACDYTGVCAMTSTSFVEVSR